MQGFFCNRASQNFRDLFKMRHKSDEGVFVRFYSFKYTAKHQELKYPLITLSLPHGKKTANQTFSQPF